MGGGGNGDSKTHRSNLVFILNPNRRPFLTPKPSQVKQKLESAAENNNQAGALDYMDTISPIGGYEFSYISQGSDVLQNPPEFQHNEPIADPSTTVTSIMRNSWEMTERHLSTKEQNQSYIVPSISSPKNDGSASILRDTWEMTEQSLYTEEQNQSYEVVSSISPPQILPKKNGSTKDDSNLGQIEKPLSLAARRLMNHMKPGRKEIVVFKIKTKRRHHPLVSINNSFSL